jgi:hypothetical protein
MYLAVLAIIVGQALVLWRPILVVYAMLVASVFVASVKGYEEPNLGRTFGEEYEAYRRTRMVAAHGSRGARLTSDVRRDDRVTPPSQEVSAANVSE